MKENQAYCVKNVDVNLYVISNSDFVENFNARFRTLKPFLDIRPAWVSNKRGKHDLYDMGHWGTWYSNSNFFLCLFVIYSSARQVPGMINQANV